MSSLESKLNNALSEVQELERERDMAVAEHHRLVEENKEVGSGGEGRDGGEGREGRGEEGS